MRAHNRFMRVHAIDVCACMFTCTNQTTRVAVWLKFVPFNVLLHREPRTKGLLVCYRFYIVVVVIIGGRPSRYVPFRVLFVVV